MTSSTAGSPQHQQLSELAARWQLRHLGGRPGLGSYVRELWQRRHFAAELARSRFRAENERDRLGAAWIILRPLINAAVYGTVFGLILTRANRPADYLPYLVTGVFMFQFFAGCLSEGARAIVSNTGLVTTLHFPRAVLPISVVLQQLFGALWMTGSLAVIVVLNGTTPALRWFGVLPALVLFTLFNLGIAFIAARMTIHLRDIAQLIPFVTRMFFYLSGVFVSMQSLLKSMPGALSVAEANPVYVFITLIRVSFLGEKQIFAIPGKPGQSYEHLSLALTWTYALAWGVGMLVIGFLFFWAAEDEYGRE